MSFQTTSCYYHNSISATKKCLRCNKSICSDDVTEYEDYHGDYMIPRAFCIPCYFSRIQYEATSNFTEILSYIFLIIWSFLVIWIFFPLLVFSYFIYRFIRNNSKDRKDKLRESREQFEKFIRSLPSNHQIDFSEEIKIFCFQCNTQLYSSDKYCPICSDNSLDNTEG